MRTFGIAPYSAEVEVDVAKQMLQLAPKMGVDFSFSDEFRIDHAFTVPLNFIRPEMDLPIVPIFTNVMAPPVPPAQRFYEVGKAIRRIIDELPLNKRVACCPVAISQSRSADRRRDALLQTRSSTEG